MKRGDRWDRDRTEPFVAGGMDSAAGAAGELRVGKKIRCGQRVKGRGAAGAAGKGEHRPAARSRGRGAHTTRAPDGRGVLVARAPAGSMEEKARGSHGDCSPGQLGRARGEEGVQAEAPMRWGRAEKAGGSTREALGRRGELPSGVS